MQEKQLRKLAIPTGGLRLGGYAPLLVCVRVYDIKGRLHRFPELRAFIDEIVEGKEEWLTRRFMKIAEKKKQHGENLTLDDIKRETSLKPNTYHKYADLIERLIRALNGI